MTNIVLESLPSMPGPLLWIADEPPTSKSLDAGYDVLHIHAQDLLSVESGVAYAWIYVASQQWVNAPLRVLFGLNKVAAVGAKLLLDISSFDSSNPGRAVVRRSSLSAITSNMGWELIESAPSDDKIQVFRRTNVEPRYSVTHLSEGDRADCLVLFQKSFGESSPSDLWDWKYGGGRGVSVIVRRRGQLVAHYGGASRSILFLGRLARAVQISDVAVDPNERGTMTKTGAFCKAASVYQDSIFGLNDQHICGFGFPNQRHLLLGKKAGFYEEVESLVELRWGCRIQKPSFVTTARAIQVADYAPIIQSLWQQMAHDLSAAIVGVRDSVYLHHRYEAHPTLVYQTFLIKRRWGTPLGLVVLRQEGDICRLVDLVGPLKHSRLLVDCARRIAAAEGAATLLAWITSGQLGWLQTADAEKYPIDIKIPGNCYVERVPVNELKNRWWLMMGDTDFM